MDVVDAGGYAAGTCYASAFEVFWIYVHNWKCHITAGNVGLTVI